MVHKTLRIIPLVALLATSITVHADGVIHRLDNQLSHIENTINGTQRTIRRSQNKYDNTQRTMTELKNGTYAEKRVERAVKNKKRRAVNSLIHRSNNAIRKATNIY
ncbi:hypothetical protein [Photobacterium iliopiscarium]|jgi:prefoldin subunit 5|uniref:Uncharacterized protein n=1 Tax=Photobacterium iliopiscarium TaxID=56192 RepID=A0A2T3MR81_9GAMM|nr:hypothetical protein [Photobacterium iliopiscarium]KJG14554.1 hypothetical protein UB38_02905 [Photobacterium iliopiscarium]PST87280.1 hypothetical protein C9I87_18310 [Photobacterium iliopiscarium]PST99310.1 hypothetical protein C9I85_12265 [Photobacterium iliopiscarium]PSV84916.1 hypothetical protein C9J51_01145 [Photobacterium iliopiscarium]PSV99661.1 hypothetical protein C9I88_00420 [Photobacterium iliopiscarium]